MNRRIDGVFTDGAITARRHAFDIAACAKSFARAGEHDTADVGIELGVGELFAKRDVHCGGHRVADLGPVQGEREYTVVEIC